MTPLDPTSFHELVRERRSIRDFTPEPIERTTLKQLVEAAQWAPSGYNTQPWRFVVVSGAVLARVRETISAHRELWVARVRDKFPPSTTKRMDRFFATLGDAPAMVFVYADHDRSGQTNPSDYAAACAATQNLLLAAHAEGLGACWLQACCEIEEELGEVLGVRNATMVSGVVLGHPAQTPPTPERKPGRVQWLGFEEESQGAIYGGCVGEANVL